MDNDTLINQARNLYTTLEQLQCGQCLDSNTRLNRLIISAYCRYQRRLNRCVLCYKHRDKDCDRELWWKTQCFCPPNNYFIH